METEKRNIALLIGVCQGFTETPTKYEGYKVYDFKPSFIRSTTVIKVAFNSFLTEGEAFIVSGFVDTVPMKRKGNILEQIPVMVAKQVRKLTKEEYETLGQKLHPSSKLPSVFYVNDLNKIHTFEEDKKTVMNLRVHRNSPKKFNVMCLRTEIRKEIYEQDKEMTEQKIDLLGTLSFGTHVSARNLKLLNEEKSDLAYQVLTDFSKEVMIDRVPITGSLIKGMDYKIKSILY